MYWGITGNLLQLEHTVSPVAVWQWSAELPRATFFLKLNCFFPTQTTPPLNCCHGFDSTVILISPWGSESDALLVVNSKHERIIINAIIKLITNVKKPQQLFNKTYFTRLKLSKRPRDIYMFWSEKECKITLMTANHTRLEQLTVPNKEVLEGRKFQSPKEKELQESGTIHWKRNFVKFVFSERQTNLYKIDFAAVTCAPQMWQSLFLAHGDHGWIHVLSFCKKQTLQGLMRVHEKSVQVLLWNPSAEVEGKDWKENQSWKVKEH